MDNKIDEIVSQMTLEEKASLCSGKDFWTTKALERLDVPSIWLSDGPHGLRKAKNSNDIGLAGSVPATCFPTASALASSWDRELLQTLGQALADEALAQGVQIVLGPGINIKRTPLGGRNFEYYSEDPLLSGELAAAFINGMQRKNIGTSLKHFAVNNQEDGRMYKSAELDQRTLHEIYLKGFEIAVKKSQPWTIMAAYNKVNGTYATEHPYLLDTLLDKWNYQGIVISDWGAVNERVDALQAGMHLEMPGGNPSSDQKIISAVKDGTLSEDVLDQRVKKILRITFAADAAKKENHNFDQVRHHQLAAEIAAESMVLLKNENNILPLDQNEIKSVAVIGDFAKNPRFQGAGSSQVTPTQLDNAFQQLETFLGNQVALNYARGYSDQDEVDQELIEQAKQQASSSDVALIFAGLPPAYESEGFDRSHIQMPPSHNQLISAVSQVNENVVVILSNGSAIAMPWLNQVDGVLESWLAGQAGAKAVVEVLFGQVNPSGKLSETFPLNLEDNPAHLNYPGENGKIHYGENLYVGYRYYDSKSIPTLFPFGYGLSYTTFDYDDLNVSNSNLKDNESLTVTFKLRNSGTRAGKEVVQLYLHDRESRLHRPYKELKGFAKVELTPDQTQIVSFTLDKEDFSYYDDAARQWIVESGEFDVLIGSSAENIRLVKTITIEATEPFYPPLTKYSPLKDWLSHPKGKPIADNILNSFKQMMGGANQESGDNFDMMMVFFLDMPMIKIANMSGGAFSEQMLNNLVRQVNQ
ncbi:MAG: glycoside hydrolase family 3 C-terminal domain-containing protein [Candidatus Cyclobacteriaceae bacterium M3_2C_046]